MLRLGLITLIIFGYIHVFAEGSKNVTPNNTGSANGSNTFIGYLQTDDALNSNNFLKPDATDDEKVYIYIRAGETLYYGLRRFNDGGGQTDLIVTLYDNANAQVMQTTLLRDQNSPNDATLLPQSGVIGTYAQATAGPSAIVGGAGYDALSYTNNTGVDQDFWVSFQETGTQERSWYDIWDFSVYDGTEEKVGRLHAKSWSFNAGSSGARLSTEFQLFTLVDNVGDGFYVKELDLRGIQPFGMLVYANSVGSTTAVSTDFRERRKSQNNTNTALPEYDLFLNNPDIEVYPTATLPEVTISDFNTICNADGTASAAVTFKSNLAGIVSIVVDLNGSPGYQSNSADVIIEAEATANVAQTLIWNGLDGNDNAVLSGTLLSVTGRYTAGPIHLPLYDVENNTVGITMNDIRPSTTFNQIYWDDSNRGGEYNSNPEIELNGTNTVPHTWSSSDRDLHNTWSYGYLQLNSQIILFTYDCDSDNDGIPNYVDADNDDDGIPDNTEGDINADLDSDGIPNYLDADFPDFVDTNNDGINDQFDTDKDGIPNALDLDSDNDGIPDVVENGGTDLDNNGIEDNTPTFAFFIEAEDAIVGSNFSTVSSISANGGEYVTTNINSTSFPGASAANRVRFTYAISSAGDYRLQARVSAPSGADNSFFVVIDDDTANPIRYNDLPLTGSGEFVYDTLHNSDEANPFDEILITFTAGSHSVDFYYREDGTLLDAVYLTLTTPISTRDTDQDGTADYLDLDSDNDGIVDVIEAGGGADFSSGIIADYTDSDGNGWNDNTEIFRLPRTNSDGGTDGLPDYRDIDSDNDGIADNREAFNSQSYTPPGAFTDTDNDGLNDTYDPNNGGFLISPVNTDNIGREDFRDTDADEDGVRDLIEGFDSNSNGFGDWDLVGSNNLITDEVGYNVDSDADGLWDIFDTEASGASAGISNVTASNAVHQNTDNADNADWQDTDDDNDDVLTSGEDRNGNKNFADDKTEGQSGSLAPPDYLFIGDYDDDGVADLNDLDSDNDGILDTDEDGGTGIDPSADDNGDGVVNYRDSSIAGFTDSNNDGVDDRMDIDQDGTPDFLDSDSDNDGMYDAYEANNGIAPSGFDINIGQFVLDDPDNDGLMNQVDNNTILSGGQSKLPKSDFDGDLIDDYRDLDSDNDGIPDNIEFQGEDNYVAPTGIDSDGNGVDDAYDPNSGGVFLTAINTDGLGEPDFRDTDSDDDGILDRIEGSDSDNNGFGDWDDNSNGLTDEVDYSSDTDGDGIVDAFDNVATINDISNITGSNAVIQNSDGLDDRDWRDTNDDNDADLTIDEDDNGNGNYTDDRSDGQGGLSDIPDYLFKGDNDSDGIADRNDSDSDNDGIPDVDEAGTLGVDPSQDADDDGIPNYRDADIAGFTDSNGDGVDDRADNDLDGVPDYHDLDSDNDGIPDAVEANNGTLPPNMTSNGQYPLSYITVSANDPDGDGFPLDVDPDDGGTPLPNLDHDGDGRKDYLDLDSDNDGLSDLIEGGGTDVNGDGRIDNFVDVNNDGLASIVDLNESGTPFTYPNSDSDSLNDYLDVDSDGDGIADATEQGGRDTNSDGELDGFVDTDNDGFSDVVDTDNGGTSLTFNDQDGDGLQNYQDLDSDNDGLSDISEGGGADADGNGLVDGSDLDANNNGYYDSVELNPFPGGDTDNDGQPDFADIDSDNDGIVDAIEIGLTVDANGRINGFLDNNGNGLNDGQEGAAISPPDSDSDNIEDHLDLDSDNDGIVDIVEAQTKSTFLSISGNDTDGDGLDDAYDPDNGGTLLIPVNTDGTGEPDYLDDDSDGDGILDIIEGDDANKDGFGDWDSDLDGVFTDEVGFNTDLDLDGILDIFDTFGGLGSANIVGSNTANQDTDNDDEFDFQDLDDDGDGINTGDGTGGTETNVFGDDPDGNIPNYLYKTRDEDGDTIEDTDDLDSDNDGIVDTDEDGGVGIDPSADADGDGRLNYEDPDFAGFVDTDNNGTDDRYDTDRDGVPDFLDLDSDNDGIPDAIEANQGIVPSVGFTVANANYDPANDADGDGLADAVDNGVTSNIVNPDTDADGIKDVLDLDSDNDGLTDNRESQVAGGSYIAPVKGDSDNDGLLNVYDGNTGATTITPVITNGSVPDYLNLDSDGDGLNDIIEGHDANSDGFADWDTDGDNSITNEIGYNADRDRDGLWNIYDTNNTVKGITNIDASNADYQDTNLDGSPDYRDVDDDGDGINTVDEDRDPSDGNYANDFTQGGVTIPDYLFFPDKDGDGILDAIDLDSDDDGISNVDEYVNAVYGSGGTPFDDADGDNIYNYLDASDVNNGSFIDINGDGVDDQVDQDYDGIPNFFDIDSDNDGIVDAIEAGGIDANNDGRQDVVYAISQNNVGTVNPANALGNPLSDPLAYSEVRSGDNITLDLGDTILSGSVVYVYLARLQPSGDNAEADITQSEDGTNFSNTQSYTSSVDVSNTTPYEVLTYTTTADTRYIRITRTNRGVAVYGARFMYKSEDFDSDGLPDYLDLDSDNDGISDNQEGQSETRIEPSGVDTDKDGLDNSYDVDNGGTAIDPINTDRLVATYGDSEPDYRDLESDGDGVEDRIEGHDQNVNGFADWDTAQDDNDYTTETGYNTDTDNDGIVDLFDVFAGFGVNNINGTIAALQDADSDGTRDWRDNDDDGDEVLTRNENFNANNFWYDDRNQGGGASPDYLFFADRDQDGLADNVSFDSDSDGIPNTVEIGELSNPYNDGDGDGIPAFQDSSEPGFADINNDGIDDRYDTDLDGIPDFLDLDSDNDGIPDALEANGGIRPVGMNSEGQYPAAYTQANDANENGLVDDVEPSQGGTALSLPDSDGDGLEDYKDLDSDNDGIPDIIEAGGADSDNDGVGDAFSDSDSDGLANAVDVDNGGSAYILEDLDGDGLPNYIDADTDNDGLSDLYEADGTDVTNDGLADVLTDTDADGWVDLYDSDNGGTALIIRDKDNDGNENYRDLDSDNDGIPDAIERNGGSLPANMNANGQYTSAYVAGSNDTDSDGLLNDTDGTTPTIVSTDGDGLPDHLDIDSDNDGIQDIIEAGGVDANNNGRVDNFVDTDGDGLADTFDSDNSGTALAIPDSDGDGILPDYRDIDADNDGIPDIVEMGGADINNDGLPANPNTDSDNDGWSDTFDSNNGGTALNIVDIDGDGLFGFQDLDSDNDGLSDVLEVNGTVDSDNDGVPDVTTDSDVDGWPDTFDNNNGAAPYTYRDTDGDGLNDFADLDSDNDGLPDALEANDGVLPANMNANGQYSTFSDTDGDGYSNDRDASNGGVLYADTDTDGDSYIDRYDLDSDNDGIPDAVEANGGSLPSNMDANGTYSVFTDTDNDGLHNDVDTDNSGTPLANPNSDNGISGGDTNRPDYRDLDADADGIVDVVEAGGLDGDNDGIIGTGIPSDNDNDGLADTVDPDDSGSALPYTDSDSDGSPNYRDTDSDNDSVDDLIEAFDSNIDVTNSGGTVDGVAGVNPSGLDSDNDGIDNNFEGAIPSFQDTDGTGGIDVFDTDDDGDGIPSTDENADINPANGTPDYLEITTNPCGANSVQVYPIDADITPSNGVSEADSDEAIGAPDGVTVLFDTGGDELDFDMRTTDVGTISVTWKKQTGDVGISTMTILESVDDGSYTTLGTSTTNDDVNFITSLFSPATNTRFIRITKDGPVPDFEVDAIGFCLLDSDNDLVADREDLDDDNDGIPDVTEVSSFGNDPSGDDDFDGQLNYEDVDIADFLDTNTDNVNDNFDQDLDGIPNHLDLDSDNDGIPDAIEANNGNRPINMTVNGRYLSSYVVSNDGDSDGLANDVDTDNSGSVFANPNSDGDANVDFLDLDSDNDGISDIIEAGGVDIDNNGRLDGNTDANDDGLISIVDSNEGGSALTVPDSDGDGFKNYRDVDSDNDGIADIREAGGADADGNGKVDISTDTDGDGWVNIHDADNGGSVLILTDTDGDGRRNYLDLDSDNDGLPDALEANGGTLPSDMDSDGQYGTLTDTDGDGLHDNVDTDNSGTALLIPNTDGLAGADYLDLDSDNDGLPDIIENGGLDVNNNGRVDNPTDTDGDGIVDAYDPDNGGTALTINDSDGDGLPTYRDLDADNDGIPDVIEFGGTDANGDGQTDNSTDNDGDGWSNTYDSDNGGTPFSNLDMDGDGLNNNIDLDTDSDGIADAYEGNGGPLPAEMNADGQYTSLLDTDGDGLHNNLDTNNGGTRLTIPNTDGTDGPDFRDIDSDGDGIFDYIEAFDDDENGNASNDFVSRAATYELNNGSGQYPATDTDSDGIPDWLEDTNGDGRPNYLDPSNAAYFDADGDGLVNLHDENSGGIAYSGVSGEPDNNGNGRPNQYDSDDDIALPVTLISFSAQFIEEKVLLRWVTATEIDNDYFDIQRSIDGIEFETIDRVKGAGFSNELIEYDLIDAEPHAGINYYRLLQVDFDGDFEYSSLVSVQVDLTDLQILIYPNPVKEIMNIRFNNRVGNIELTLTDIGGGVVLKTQMIFDHNKEAINLDLSELTSGIYFLNIENSGVLHQQKFFVE